MVIGLAYFPRAPRIKYRCLKWHPGHTDCWQTTYLRTKCPSRISIFPASPFPPRRIFGNPPSIFSSCPPMEVPLSEVASRPLRLLVNDVFKDEMPVAHFHFSSIATPAKTNFW